MSNLPTQSINAVSFDAGAGRAERASHSHSVQFYRDDDFLLDGVSRFISAALLAGDSALAIATKSHREGLPKRLSSRGIDLTAATSQGRYLALDAAATMSYFMVDGCPDATLFSRVIGNAITQLGEAAQSEYPRVAAFGEMVALLWAQGDREAAIQLEKLWNHLAETHAFYLHCAYPIHLFSQEKDGDLLQTICSEHCLVVPTEGYTTLAGDEDRRRSIVFLEQKAQALETEILERKKADQSRRESEEMLLLAQQIGSIGSFEWHIEKDVSRWTPEWAALHGLSPEGFSGTQAAWKALIHPDDRSKTLSLVKASFAISVPMQGEWRVVWPDGSVHWLAAKWQVIRDKSGKPLRISGVNMDISDKKRAEEALLRLAAIVQSSNDAIIGKDLNGIVTSWNQAAENIFGYRAEEMVGRSILQLIPPELHHQEPMFLARIAAGEEIEHFETVRLRKDGERLNVSLTISPVRNQAGNIIGAAKIARNITRQKKLEEKLRTSEKLAAVGRLAAAIAHEINNPLAAVTNLLYLARQQTDLREPLNTYLRSADNELRRVSHIVRQTLGFYRDDSLAVEFGVAKAVDDVLIIYEDRLKRKALHVEKRIRRGLLVRMREGEFKQILSNLLANAIDASKERGRILIHARSCRHLQGGNDGIRVTLADGGVGVSPENQHRLFTPFFTTNREAGTGLGLWVTKDLIEKRGGSIRFRSQTHAKSGTAMSFFIPVPPVTSRSGRTR